MECALRVRFCPVAEVQLPAQQVGRLRRRHLRLLIKSEALDGAGAIGGGHGITRHRSSSLSSSNSKAFTTTLFMRARCCASIVTAAPRLLDFGDCEVGKRKEATIELRNQSDLPARVTAFVAQPYAGSAVTVQREHFLLPRQKLTLTLGLLPQVRVLLARD